MHTLILALLFVLAATLSAEEAATAAARDELVEQVVLSLSTVEAPVDGAAYWHQWPAETVEILIGIALDAEQPQRLRARALSALSVFPTVAAELALVRVAGDETAGTLRLRAACALALQGLPAALAHLEALLAADAEAREAAIEALAFSSSPAALTRLTALLGEASSDEERLRIHMARSAWLTSYAPELPPGLREPLVLRARRAELRDDLVTLGGPVSEDSSAFDLCLSAGAGITKSTAIAPGVWRVERAPGAESYWLAVEIFADDEDGAPRLVAVVAQTIFVVRR